MAHVSVGCEQRNRAKRLQRAFQRTDVRSAIRTKQPGSQVSPTFGTDWRMPVLKLLYIPGIASLSMPYT